MRLHGTIRELRACAMSAMDRWDELERPAPDAA